MVICMKAGLAGTASAGSDAVGTAATPVRRHGRRVGRALGNGDLLTPSAATVRELLGVAAHAGQRVVVCDRWSAYEALARAGTGVLQLAFCPAHWRPNFRCVGAGFAVLQNRSESSLNEIGRWFWPVPWR